ncbi:MAG TPA: TonB-dependent receptor [Vicinamibacterales bacterium]|nr:TonB-dependent receptor [Vicinamibacterales bacterium]
MRTPSRLIGPIVLCLAALHSTYAEAQALKHSTSGGLFEPVTRIAAIETGLIEGKVTDEAGKPLDGAVISALGGTTAFAVSDSTGQFTLKQLPPGPYLLRAHLAGFLAARSTMVNVRASAKSASSFTLRREGSTTAPRVTEASVGAIGAPPPATAKTGDRDESELGWRLRHLKRGVLRDTDTLAGVPRDDDWFITDSFEFLGRAFESSARAAKSAFSDISLGGQVNLLTTGAFDNPLQLLQLDRTNNVAFFSVGASVGLHGDWNVRAAMNQTDLSSWMLAGSYVVKAQVPHQYRFGMSYSLQRYEGGNTAALQALSDTARNVGSVFAYDEWQISRYVAVSYGGTYARYDYMEGGPAQFSPSVSATFSPTKSWRLRASASRDVSAPGAEEFIPPSSAEYLPPQRTFSPLSKAGMRTQEMQNYAFAVERVLNGATIAVRSFEQRIDDQTVTVFGLQRGDAASLGHYYVGAAGDASVHGVGVTFTHALFDNVRGSIDYSVATANWTDRAEPIEYAVLTRWIPSAVRPLNERIHDVTTSLETEIPQSATRVVVLYKLNNAFASPDRSTATPAFGARFDLQVNQALPFMNFGASQWEMLVGVRNLFHESLANTSAYDELLVVHPPKRLVGGLTVKF